MHPPLVGWPEDWRMARPRLGNPAAVDQTVDLIDVSGAFVADVRRHNYAARRQTVVIK
jgi:hypothetical protein